jgi:hypothetical protein
MHIDGTHGRGVPFSEKCKDKVKGFYFFGAMKYN